jgi:TonB family protein
MLASPNAPARPKLELNAGAAPRLTQQRMQNGDAGPPPDVEQSRQNSANASTLIAISAAPGPAMPRVPQGNLAARVSISPEGTQPGAPHGETARAAENKSGSGSTSDNHSASPGGGAGKDAATVSISGGNPPAKTGISGLGGNPQPKIDTSAARGFSTKIDPRVRIEDVQRTGPPNFAALPPGAKPEQVFASKKMYTLLVNMPNLNSATGSWILNFSELRGGPGQHVAATDLAGPVPVKKSDPKYPPTLINERVEGEVVLYAVIRADGSVDSVQLVRGIDERLDANAMAALSQWKFRPASRQGEPVDLEAIVHIPFHLPAER